MLTTPTHIYFYNGSFSNWKHAPFTDDVLKKTFFNSEQAFMFYKAKFFNDAQAMKLIENTANPAEAKSRGRAVKGYNQAKWAATRMPFMVYCCYLKFNQNPALGQELLDTGDKTLVEASVEDCVWGVGLDESDPLILDESNWRGENLLGKALMQVRDLLREDIKNGTTWQPVRMP